MNERFLVIVCEIILIGAVIVALMIILVASWHDLRTAASNKHLQRIANKLHKPRQPSVAIVVRTWNNQASIEDCLDSILESRYAKYHIIVADHGSTDRTLNIVKKYRQHHKTHPITLYAAKASTPLNTVTQRAIQKLPPCEFNLLLNPLVNISPNTLRSAMAEYIDNPKLTDLHLHMMPANDLSIRTLTSYFSALTKNIVYKALSVVHLLPQSNSNSNSIRFIKNTPSTKHTRHYSSRITYQQNQTTNHQSSLAYLSLIVVLWLALTLLLTYWMLTAATLKSNLFLSFSWTIVCIWLLATTWSDGAMKLGRKVELTLSVPFMYFVFYPRMISDLFVKLWQIIKKISFNAFAQALQSEFYSTRY